ncbi:hypothetical protein Y032_0024g1040 [Ancylostoma ceylanicum]|uniref:Secreted protein n=1 Tax=Ancylostoma ceylanicum TaxID=53326 RepID=A0A016UV98_9BILA|nr:hypothetical protein Y032_0024g1040 [Ancylostoma ceylanicum]
MVTRFTSLVVLLIVVADSHKNIDWCLYFRILRRDHLRPECNGIYRARVSRQKDHPPPKLLPLPREFLPSFRRFKIHRTSVADLTRRALGLSKELFHLCIKLTNTHLLV